MLGQSNQLLSFTIEILAQLSVTSKNKWCYVHSINFQKNLQEVRQVSSFSPLIKIGTKSPESRPLNNRTTMNRDAYVVWSENINRLLFVRGTNFERKVR
jgi:hypothetical protein